MVISIDFLYVMLSLFRPYDPYYQCHILILFSFFYANCNFFFFFSSRRRHTRLVSDWSSDVCSSDLDGPAVLPVRPWLALGASAGGRGAHAHRADAQPAVGLPDLSADGHAYALHFNRRPAHHRRRSEERRVGKERR